MRRTKNRKSAELKSSLQDNQIKSPRLLFTKIRKFTRHRNGRPLDAYFSQASDWPFICAPISFGTHCCEVLRKKHSGRGPRGKATGKVFFLRFPRPPRVWREYRETILALAMIALSFILVGLSDRTDPRRDSLNNPRVGEDRQRMDRSCLQIVWRPAEERRAYAVRFTKGRAIIAAQRA